MAELIKIDYSNDTPLVSAREVHDYLDLETPFNKWFPRMCEYGFEEGKDYWTFLSDRSDGLPGKPRQDAQLTVGMAKEICMIQRNEKGRQARQYFIKVEDEWKSQRNKPMTQAEITLANAQAIVDHERRMDAIEASQKALSDKLDKAAEAFTAPSYSADTWQENARATIAAIVQENGLSYQAYTGELYQRLESAAGVNLKSRQVFKQKRMKAEGARYRERQAVTKLNVIADDAKLRLVFDHILAMEKAKRLMKGGASA